jgi:malate/lactate dehydrogenase
MHLPSQSAQMVEAILKDKHLIVPRAAYLDGEYGLKDLFGDGAALAGKASKKCSNTS